MKIKCTFKRSMPSRFQQNLIRHFYVIIFHWPFFHISQARLLQRINFIINNIILVYVLCVQYWTDY